MSVSIDLVNKVRTALRLSGTDVGITTEITDSIEACKRELEEVGVVNVSETDTLIIRAAILHAKADFDFCGKGESFRNSFEQLKGALAMAEDYNTVENEGDA